MYTNKLNLREKVLSDFSTRRLVREVLEFADKRDIVDAIHDLQTVVRILSSEMPI